VLHKVAHALGASVADLRGADTSGVGAPAERPWAFESLRLTLTGHPAVGIVLAGEQDTLTEQRLAQIRERNAQVWPLVHASRYNKLAPLVAVLIPDLVRAVRTDTQPGMKRETRALLTDTYQAVAAMLAKTGESDAAWIAADRAALAAEALGDPLQLAASLLRMACVFLSLEQSAQVQAVAGTALVGLGQQSATPEALSLLGSFHLVLAVSAARDNDRGRAYEHLGQAREIASEIGQDRNDFGTEFGPTNTALHAVFVAVEVGDACHALDIARDIQPESLSAERQARHSIDLAKAHAMRRQIGEALRCLKNAEELTPEQTRTHWAAREVARELLQLRPLGLL
jgi:tetratricopeptide (TPR) repeat protein